MIKIIDDFLIRNIKRRRDKYKFAFIVHSRSHNDFRRKFPYMRMVPDFILDVITSLMWPIRVSEVTGNKSADGKESTGVVIGFPMTASQMLKNRKLALKKIIQSVHLAEKLGVTIVGLGALTSSLSKGGIDLIDKTNVGITTGHAYTVYNVFSHIERVFNDFDLDRSRENISIVGASGSIGSSVVKSLAENGFKIFNLIDVSRKVNSLNRLKDEILSNIDSDIEITISENMNSLTRSSVIVTATNTPEALVMLNHVKPGTIIINDASPTDVSDEVLRSDDRLVIEAGFVKTPGVTTHFSFGFIDDDISFCCMAEILALSANNWEGNFVIGKPTQKNIDDIIKMSKGMGFGLPRYQNFYEIIPDSKIKRMRELLNKK